MFNPNTIRTAFQKQDSNGNRKMKNSDDVKKAYSNLQIPMNIDNMTHQADKDYSFNHDHL